MKKECEFFRDKLMDFSVGELEADISEKIKKHIEICTECWKIVDDFKKTNSIIASFLKVDFSEDVWAMQRDEIIKKATQKIDIKNEIKNLLKILFTTKRVLTTAVMAIVLIFCIAIGGVQYKKNMELNKERIIIENIGLLENIEILERFDLYKKIYEKGINL